MSLAQTINEQDLELVRFVWCDLHGMTRGKTLTKAAALKAIDSGVGMVSTAMLKDSSDHTVFEVFGPDIAQDLPGFEGGNTLLLRPIASTFKVLPWADKTGWVQCQPYFQDGSVVPHDSRHQLQQALQQLSDKGLHMVCGLEVELHIYRLQNPQHDAALNPHNAAWPGPAPEVSMVHPGFNLLSEACVDMAHEPLRIVQHTAQALGLPLLSLEVEFGPSQVEAVFEATDALTAADNMVLFRSAARQALRRAGYHATFMCRPPFEHIMSSGWHLHQSLVHSASGTNAFMRHSAAPKATKASSAPSTEATHSLSDLGTYYLAGLLQHAPAMTALCTPTANGYARFQPNALAPHAFVWGHDNRGAMLRVVGGAGDSATRIENRLGEPAANPYLYMASQVHAGLHGMAQQLKPPPATDCPYAHTPSDPHAVAIPANLEQALQALQADKHMCSALGDDFVRYFVRIKTAEHQRFEAANAAGNSLEFQRREYFNRI